MAKYFTFSHHAVERMFERLITVEDVKQIVKYGQRSQDADGVKYSLHYVSKLGKAQTGLLRQFEIVVLMNQECDRVITVWVNYARCGDGKVAKVKPSNEVRHRNLINRQD